MSWSQYAQTFRDVAEDESVFWHPFDHLFYELVYKGIAAGGNCFGMCLESVYAQVGRSIFSEPISRFGPQNGNEPNPNNARDQEIINEINIKHGYQVSGGVIDWFLGKFLAGHTHDPVRAFRESRDAYYRGDYPVLAVTSKSLNIGGHVVRPYRWDDSNPNRWIMYIADPNVPAAKGSDDSIRCRIEINPTTNSFRYQHGNNVVWESGAWSGGRMYSMPFSLLCNQPRTPFWEVLALVTLGTLIILGDDGQTQQLTDKTGRTFYEPGLSAAPTEWQQIRQDANLRIPNLTRVPLLKINSINVINPIMVDLLNQPLPELYYVRGNAETIRHEIVGQRAGQYRWGMRSALRSSASLSPYLSASAVVPIASGAADLITVERMNAVEQSVSLSVAATGVAKQATLTLSGVDDETVPTKRFELRNLGVTPGGAITARLSDGGQELLLENAGSQATFELRVQSGANEQASTVRPSVTIEAGQAARIRPADWAENAIANTPLRMDITHNLRGDVLRRIDL